MKIFKRIFGALASIAMIAAPVAMSGAVGAVKPLAPDNTSVIIKKQVKEVTNPVTNTFTFKVDQDSKNPATVTLPITGGNTFEIPFNAVAPNPATKIAEQTFTLDFANVDFPKVGDYYFKIYEPTTGWSTNTDNVYPHDADYWYAYVSVRYVTDGNPTQVSGTPTSTMKATVALIGTENTDQFVNPDPTATPGTPAYEGNKSQITFDTTPDMTYIELEKKVTGNLGDITKYFEYTINLGSAMASTATIDKYVTILDRDGNGFSTNGTSNTSANPAVGDSASVKVDTSGNIKVYLKHNQGIIIGLTALSNGHPEIPLKINATTNTSYTITETKDAADAFHPELAYTIYIDGTEDADGAITKTVSPLPVDPSNTTAADTIAFNTNNKTSYKNNKEADPITGLFINYWPFMLLVALGVLGFYIMKKTSKKEQ